MILAVVTAIVVMGTVSGLQSCSSDDATLIADSIDGLQKTKEISMDSINQDKIANSKEFEEFILAGIEYQNALNSFKKELKSIDFSKIDVVKNSKGEMVLQIPTSISIEDDAKAFNNKKKSLLEKYPDFSSKSISSINTCFQQSISKSSKIKKRMTALKPSLNQPRFKSHTSEYYYNNDDLFTFLDTYLTTSTYTEVVIIVLKNGTSIVYSDSEYTSSTCGYPPLLKYQGEWYLLRNQTSPIKFIAHTHRYTSTPTDPDDYDYENLYPGLNQAIYTSGGNYNHYEL
jgi:hypothetical protein